jgi:hypothetical protein
MPERETLDCRNAIAEPVERDVPGPAARNHKFANVAPYGAADQSVVAQDARRISDALRGAGCAGGIMLGNEVEQTFEVRQRAGAEADGRQVRALSDDARGMKWQR